MVFGRKKTSKDLETKVTDYRRTLLGTVSDSARRKTMERQLIERGVASKAPNVFMIKFDTRGKDEEPFLMLQAFVYLCEIAEKQGGIEALRAHMEEWAAMDLSGHTAGPPRERRRRRVR